MFLLLIKINELRKRVGGLEIDRNCRHNLLQIVTVVNYHLPVVYVSANFIHTNRKCFFFYSFVIQVEMTLTKSDNRND